MQICLVEDSDQYAWDDFVGKHPAGIGAELGRHGYHARDLGGGRDEERFFIAVGRKDNQLKVDGHRINNQCQGLF